MKCRWELARFRWQHIPKWPKYQAIFSLLAMVALLSVALPDNDAIVVAVLIISLFLMFSFIFAMAMMSKNAITVNKRYRNDLNIIRRKYGVPEK